jgi:hypothetical protein
MASARLLLVVAALIAVLPACNEAPSVLAVDVDDGSALADGPYEVRVSARSDDGFGPARLLVRDGRPASDLALSEGLTPDATRGAFRGSLAGAPPGTIIRFAVEICDPHGACTVDPASWPAEAHAFVVGRTGGGLVIERLDPPIGPASGGTVVLVHGDGFGAAPVVDFGGIAAAHVERLDAGSLRVVTPAHGVGLVDVTVRDGRALATLRGGFTFTATPRVDAVEPGSGPTAGGTPLTISGADFDADVRILVDGVPCRRSTRIDAATLQCVTPPGRAGDVVVDVVAVDGGRGSGAFTYREAPRVDGVEPPTGNSDGGTRIVITGDHFDERTPPVVRVGEADCVDVVVIDPRQLTCTTTAMPPGAASVVIENADGQQGVLPGGFGALGPPLLFLVLPDEGPRAGGVEVRLLGAGLAPDDVISFGGVPAEVLDAVDDLELLVRVPPSALPLVPAPVSGFAAVDVEVRRERDDDDRAFILPGGFRYRWPPEVLVVQPGSGPTAGGTRVVVVGRFFTDGMGIVFDGRPCTDVVVISSSEALCTTPAGEAGPADVVADGGDIAGPGATATGAFTYVPPPRIDRISPDEGPTFGGDRVVLTGEGFLPGMVVRIDGAACGALVVESTTRASCTTPPGARGPADVVAVNPDGQSDTAPGLYTYVGVSVVPDHGLPVGFTRVVVRAAGLAPGVVFTFGGRTASCERRSGTEAICQTPARPGGATGVVEVRFRNPDGTGDGDDAFTYTAFANQSARVAGLDRNANHVVLVDVDNDGDLDPVIANGRVGTPESSEVYENTGLLRFSRRDIPGTLVTGNKVDVGRINSDAFPDLVVAASNSVGAVLLASDGPGRWNPIELPLTAENSAFDAQLADVVGNDRDDLIVLGIGCDPILDLEQSPGCDPNRQGRDVIFEQTGTGGSSRLTRRDDLIPHEARQVHDHKMVIFDVDGDDDNDIFVVVNNDPYTSAEHRLLRNRVREGRGFVKETAGFQELVGDLYDVDAGDIDGDGDDDVVTAICLGDGAVSSEVILRNDNGTLRLDETALPVVRIGCAVGSRLIDVDSDGDLDALWTGTVDARRNPVFEARLYVNRGDGTFVDASAHLPVVGRILQGNHAAGADLDGDGDVDLVIAGGAPYSDTGRPGAVLLFEQR